MDASFDFVRRIVPATETAFFIPAFPLFGASIDLDFAGNRIFPSGAFTDYLSISRASNGFAKTSAGTLTSFGNNTLRRTDLGLLIEDSRTNNKTASQDFTDGAQWNTVTNATITGDTTTAPDGTTTADSIVPTTTSSSQHEVGATAGTATAAPWTVSCYFKPNGYNFGALQVSNGTVDTYWVFDLILGTSTTSNSGSAPTGVTTYFEALANNWVRVAVTLDAAASAISIRAAVSDQATLHAWAGDGVKGIFAWGYQVEAGAFPSSYITTTSAAATRAADAVNVISTLDTILSTLPHSDVANIITLAAPPAGLWTICGDDTHNPVDLSARGNNLVDTFNNAALVEATFGSGLWTTGAKVAVGKATGATSVVGNGGTIVTEAAGNAGTSGSIYLGSGAAGFRNIFGYIRRFTVWNSKLADATLQGFTV